MKDEGKTKKQLRDELKKLREKIRALRGVAGVSADRGKSPAAWEPHYRALIEQIPAITYIAALDEASTTLFVSPQIKEFLGYSPEDYLADPDIWRKRLHPADRERVLADLSRNRAAGKPFQSEYRMIARDGRTVWFRDHACVVRDETGAPLFLQGIMYDITAHRKADEALAESEAFHHALLHASADGILVATRDAGRFLYANPAVCRMLGYPEEELRRMGVADIHPEDKLERVLSEFRAQVRGEKPLAADIPFLRRDGTVFWADVDSTPLTIGGEECLLGIVRDTTERKKADEALRESEEKFRSITAAAKDAIIMMDAGGSISYWNRAAEDIFGYTRAEALGKDLHLFLAPERFHEAYRKGIVHFIERGEGAVVGKTLELSAVRKGGAEFPVELSVSAVRMRGQWSAIGILRDISARKSAENELLRSEAKFRSIFDNAKDAIFIESPDGKIIDVNAAACALLGYSRKKLCTMNVGDIVAPQMASRLPAEIQPGTVREGVYVESLEMRRNGKFIPVEVSNTLVTIGGERRVIAIVRDITSRKRAERAIRERSMELRARVRELGCLYRLRSITGRPGVSLDEALDETARLIASTFRRPGECGAKISLGEKVHATDNFTEAARAVSRPLMVHGERVGAVKLGCAGGEAADGKAPFRKEETSLLELVADILSRYLESERDERERTALQKKLEDALAKALSGYLPICASCKKIRDDEGRWVPVEIYIKGHTQADFTHGICPSCAKELYPNLYDK